MDYNGHRTKYNRPKSAPQILMTHKFNSNASLCPSDSKKKSRVLEWLKKPTVDLGQPQQVGSIKKGRYNLLDPRLLFKCVSYRNNRTEEETKRSLGLLKLLLEYYKKKKKLPFLDSCEVSLSPVCTGRKGNICMYAICQNNVKALELLLNYSLTLDMFNFSLVRIVVNSIYAMQQKHSIEVTNTTEMLQYLEKEFGRNIVYDHINRVQKGSLETSLHVACAVGDVKLVQLLLENGASKSIYLEDFLGQTPLHVVLAHCDRPDNIVPTVKLLMQYIDTNVAQSLFKGLIETWIAKAPEKYRDELSIILGVTNKEKRQKRSSLSPRNLFYIIKNHHRH